MLNELQGLEDVRGRLEPERVVAYAKNPKRALHAAFLWDDAEAAYKHRLQLARELIRSVKIEVHTETTTIESFKYVHDPLRTGRDQGYVSVKQLLLEPENAADVIAREFKMARACLDRANSIALSLAETNETRKTVQTFMREALTNWPKIKQVTT